MNNRFVGLIAGLIAVSACMFSCGKDTETADPRDNWVARNDAFLDSIARVAKSHPENEKWDQFLNYKLKFDNSMGGGSIGTYMPMKTDYVYVKYLGKPASGVKPLSTDSVYVSYRGKLIDGTVFDESYSGEFDPAVCEPTGFRVSAVITGWTTALMEMSAGTRAELYIPYGMAYGQYGSGEIPGYSTLIFDVYLEKIVHPKGPDDRSLKQD